MVVARSEATLKGVMGWGVVHPISLPPHHPNLIRTARRNKK